MSTTALNLCIFRMIWIVAFILFFVSCNQTPSPTPPPPQGYTLEVRGGTTNVDYSFLQSTNLSSQQNSQRLKTLQGFLSNRYDIHFQDTAAVGVNLFVSIDKNGGLVDQDIPLNVAGPAGRYNTYTPTLSANRSWTVLFPLPPMGSGAYTVRAVVENGQLSGSVNIDIPSPNTSPGELLPIAQELQVNSTKNLTVASWKPVTGAQSYIALLYYPAANEVIWSSVTKDTTLNMDGLSLSENTPYELDVFALSWDATLSTKTPFPRPLPNRFNASVVAQTILARNPQLSTSKSRLYMVASPASNIKEVITLGNNSSGPLKYEISLTGPDAGAFQLLSNTSGTLITTDFSKPASTSVELQGNCPNTEGDLLAFLNIKTNDPSNANAVIPLSLECSSPSPLQAERIYSRSSFIDIKDVAWSPDGKTFALLVGDFSKATLTLWDGASGQLLRSAAFPTTNYPPISGMTWSPDSKKVILALKDSSKIVDASTGSELLNLSGFPDMRKTAWSPDGNKVAVASSAKIGVFSSSTGQELVEIDFTSNYADDFTNILWSSKNQLLIPSTNGIEIYNPDTGSKVRTILYQGLTGPLTITPDGNLVCSFGTAYVNIWDTSTGNLVEVIAVGDYPNDLKISPDGTKIAVYLQLARKIEVYNFSTRAQITQLGTIEATRTPGKLSWNPQSNQLLALEGGDIVRVWDLTGKALRSLNHHPGVIETLEFTSSSPSWISASPSGGSNGYGYAQGTINLSNTSPAPSLQLIFPTFYPKFTKWLSKQKIASIVKLSSGYQYLLKTWDTLGNPLSSFSIPMEVDSASWSPDGSQVAYRKSGYSSPWTVVYSETGQVALNLGTAGNPYSELVWSPDASQIAAVANPTDIFDAKTGNKLRSINTGSNLTWTASNKLVGINYSLTVVDVPTGAMVLQKDLYGISKVGVSNRRVVVSKDSGLEIWSLANGRTLLSIPRPPDDPIVKLVFSPDGQYIALGTSSGGIEVWQVKTAP